MADVDLRFVPLADAEVRLDEGDGRPSRVVGMAPPWNSWSVDLGGFREQFAPGLSPASSSGTETTRAAVPT